MRVLLIDDEKPARDRIHRMLLKHPGVEIVGECENGLEALNAIDLKNPDVIFLDIEMPELNGIEVAATLLNSSKPSPAIVFVTAFSDYAVKAFEVNAIDYVVKPVNEVRLTAAVEKFRKVKQRQATMLETVQSLNLPRADKKFGVKVGAKFVVCEMSKISAILAKDHYSAIIVGGKELLSDEPLDSLLAKLDSQEFVRVHRSGIINTSYLRELEREGDRKYFAVLSDEKRTKVPISREKLNELKTLLNLR